MRYGDGRVAVEFTFAIPLDPRDGFPLHPITGLPILYTGRFDMLAQARTGALFIEDDKTTGQLGLNFTRSMKLRSQFTGYTWACQQLGFPTAGVIVRATNPLRGDIKFAEIHEGRSPHVVTQWYRQLAADTRNMVAMWENYNNFGEKLGEFSADLDDACGSYGGCPYLEACLSPDPQTVVENFFADNTWDPLVRDAA